MSRPTVLTAAHGKTLTGDDLPQRHKSILHLITEPTFLSNDNDFSLSRPFATNPGRHKNRSSMPSIMHHLDRDQTPVEQSTTRKRALPQSGDKLASHIDLSWSSAAVDDRPRKALSKQAEVMIQGKLLLRSDLPVPEPRVSKAKQERVEQYMNSHLMRSSMRQRGTDKPSLP